MQGNIALFETLGQPLQLAVVYTRLDKTPHAQTGVGCGTRACSIRYWDSVRDHCNYRRPFARKIGQSCSSEAILL
jgi:hypothetical protein